jgi:CBS domain-containing protein
MTSAGAETLSVVDGEHFLGAIGLRDLFTASVPAHYGIDMQYHREADDLLVLWERTPANYLMNENFIAVTEEAPLLRAAELMVNTDRHPLPVLWVGRLVGIVSRADVIRGLLAKHEERHKTAF